MSVTLPYDTQLAFSNDKKIIAIVDFEKGYWNSEKVRRKFTEEVLCDILIEHECMLVDIDCKELGLTGIEKVFDALRSVDCLTGGWISVEFTYVESREIKTETIYATQVHVYRE